MIHSSCLWKQTTSSSDSDNSEDNQDCLPAIKFVGVLPPVQWHSKDVRGPWTTDSPGPLPILPGGTHLEKGYGDVQPLRPPFHALSAVPQEPHFSMFPFFKTLFSTKVKNLNKNMPFKSPHLSKISVPKPQIMPKFSSLGTTFSKNSVL